MFGVRDFRKCSRGSSSRLIKMLARALQEGRLPSRRAPLPRAAVAAVRLPPPTLRSATQRGESEVARAEARARARASRELILWTAHSRHECLPTPRGALHIPLQVSQSVPPGVCTVHFQPP